MRTIQQNSISNLKENWSLTLAIYMIKKPKIKIFFVNISQLCNQLHGIVKTNI